MNTPTIQYFKPSETIVSKANVRPAGKVIGIDVLANDIQQNNQLQPVIIRMEEGTPAVIAGQRRRKALLQLEKFDDEIRMAGIVVAADDYEAAAISLSENRGQSPMSIIDYQRAFARLALQGWENANIAQVYSMSEIEVRQTLAIGGLPASVIKAYENDEIDSGCLKVLAIADKAKIRDWVTLHKQGEAPTHYRHLRSFLANNKRVIATKVALFDVTQAELAIVEDFFEAEEFFADSDEFWALQNTEIQTIKADFESKGWTVELLHESYYEWEYTSLAKKKGGKVYIFVNESGNVEVKRGIVTYKELRALEKSEVEQGDTSTASVSAEKPEVTKKLNEYLLGYLTLSSQHTIINDNDLALRLLLVMLLNNDGLLSIGHCEQLGRVNSEITNGQLFDAEPHKEISAFTKQALKRIGTSADESSYSRDYNKVFRKVMKLTAEEVQEAVRAVVASMITLSSQSSLAVNQHTKPDMTAFWQPEHSSAFFDVISSKPLLLSLLQSLTDKPTADGHANDKVKDIRALVAEKATEKENWIPAYFSGGKYGNGVGSPMG